MNYSQPLDAPDEEGFWAFEGSWWEQKKTYIFEGVEYDEWDENWDEDYDDRRFVEVKRTSVLGEPIKELYYVRYAKGGEGISTRFRSGPHDGSHILGFLFSHPTWQSSIQGFDKLVGKWTRVYLPWERQL